jgi:hypothetical protein
VDSGIPPTLGVAIEGNTSWEWGTTWFREGRGPGSNTRGYGELQGDVTWTLKSLAEAEQTKVVVLDITISRDTSFPFHSDSVRLYEFYLARLVHLEGP